MTKTSTAAPVTLPSSFEKIASFLSLFTSGGTLVCCALPALFVGLGAGATLAGLVGRYPFLIILSENKGIVFGVAGLLLSVAGFLQWKAKDLPCPVDPKVRDACARSRKFSLIIYFVSLGTFAVGGIFAFVLPLVL